MKIQKMMVALVFMLAFSGIAGGALAACPADLSGDGSVGAADLALVLGAWGTCGGVCTADVTGDGVVGAADLAIILGAWGGVCPLSCDEDGGLCTPAVFGCIGGTEEAPELSGTCESQAVCCVPVPNECTDAGGVCAVELFGCAGETTEEPALSPSCESDQVCCI